MNRIQRSFLVLLLHQTPIPNRDEVLNSEIQNFGINENGISEEIALVKDFFNNGIKNLNSSQLNSILALIKDNNLKRELIINRLTFFEIENQYHDNIFHFFQDYVQSNEAIDVDDFAEDFHGVQVATREDFNTIINRGWTGDWELDPDNIIPRRVQIASLNYEGDFPRGYYINADIERTEPINYGQQIRHRIYIINPVLVNAGKRNVKFGQNPVRYYR